MNASTAPSGREDAVGNTPTHHSTRKATRTMTDTITGDVRTSPRLQQAMPLTPFAAGLHRLAAFITRHHLPQADLALLTSADTVIADLTETAGLHPLGAVRQWAKALNTEVTATSDVSGGRLYRLFEARGYTEDLVLVRVVARQLITEAVA